MSNMLSLKNRKFCWICNKFRTARKNKNRLEPEISSNSTKESRHWFWLLKNFQGYETFWLITKYGYNWKLKMLPTLMKMK